MQLWQLKDHIEIIKYIMQNKKSTKVVINRIEKVNSELLTLTYGAIVS